MKRLDTLVRVLWCETATLAIVLTGDIPTWLALLVLTLIPVFGFLPLEGRVAALARRFSSHFAVVYLLFFPWTGSTSRAGSSSRPCTSCSI